MLRMATKKVWTVVDFVLWVVIVNFAQTKQIVKVASVYIANVKVNCLIIPRSIDIVVIIAPSCNDGVKNGDEEGIDCGIPCKKNCNGKKCLQATDCWSGVCSSAKTCSGRHRYFKMT